MLRLVITCSLLVGGTLAQPDAECGVVSGTGWPFLARLRGIRFQSTFCGATVINTRYVVTIENCLESIELPDILVIVGDIGTAPADSGAQQFSVDRVINQRQNSQDTRLYLMSLIKLNDTITYSSTVGRICLPNAGQNYDQVTATIAGIRQEDFSSPQASDVRFITVTIYSQDRCQTASGVNYHSSILCAGDYSQADAPFFGFKGGPLVTTTCSKVYLAAVLAKPAPSKWFVGTHFSVRVDAYLSWIQSNTADGDVTF